MAESEPRRIAYELLSEPHIAGRRISVRQVYALVSEPLTASKHGNAEFDKISSRYTGSLVASDSLRLGADDTVFNNRPLMLSPK